MVDIEKIKKEIEDLKNLNAEEYCKEAVQKIYEDFEANREAEIAKLESALIIFENYKIVEETEDLEETILEAEENTDNNYCGG